MKALVLALAAAALAAPAPKAPQKVSFHTKDGWTLGANYRAPRKGGAVIVLAHGVGASKGEWDPLADRLAAEGVGSLAIDLRGHADSRRGPLGTRTFEDFDATGEWPKAQEDFRAAARWLKSRGVPASRIAFGGASIGANLASHVASEDTTARFLVLLSPGPDYRGVPLTIRPGLKTLVGASSGDGYAYQTLKPLSSVPGVETFEAPSGHGAQMFADAATLDKIVRWIVAASR